MEKLTRAEKSALQKITSRGGKARAAALTPERRSEIAKKAVAAREAKRKQKRKGKQ